MTADMPRPFDEAFLADLPYDPEVLMFDEILDIDETDNRVVCRMPTDRPLPFTISQRAHPIRHPRHVAGGTLVHASGMLGFVHAYYLHGLRHADGWIGYGTHIYQVVFRKLVPPGEPIIASCKEIRARRGATRQFVKYTFEFHHEGDLCYQGEQSAMWTKITEQEDEMTSSEEMVEG
jgi:3-hydroxymyristoyl/3-hydroxydecanoyl-(acyl carrier protein) dehydratase